mmetsp:Transcript_6677/g.22527  ORF Transcript_6677/g.22527 Transcript_6677/m.22527 type:complete len:256 (+) Transcript_6677:986-1753(+)
MFFRISRRSPASAFARQAAERAAEPELAMDDAFACSFKSSSVPPRASFPCIASHRPSFAPAVPSDGVAIGHAPVRIAAFVVAAAPLRVTCAVENPTRRTSGIRIRRALSRPEVSCLPKSWCSSLQSIPALFVGLQANRVRPVSAFSSVGYLPKWREREQGGAEFSGFRFRFVDGLILESFVRIASVATVHAIPRSKTHVAVASMQLRSHEFSIRRCVVSISRVEAPSGKLHSVNKNLNLWSVSCAVGVGGGGGSI